MDDPYVRDRHLSTHDDHTLDNSHASEEPTTKVEERWLNEEHNKRQHKPENEEWHLLKKKKLNKMADQRFLDFMYRKLST